MTTKEAAAFVGAYLLIVAAFVAAGFAVQAAY